MKGRLTDTEASVVADSSLADDQKETVTGRDVYGEPSSGSGGRVESVHGQAAQSTFLSDSMIDEVL